MQRQSLCLLLALVIAATAGTDPQTDSLPGYSKSLLRIKVQSPGPAA